MQQKKQVRISHRLSVKAKKNLKEPSFATHQAQHGQSANEASTLGGTASKGRRLSSRQRRLEGNYKNLKRMSQASTQLQRPKVDAKGSFDFSTRITADAF